MARRLCSAGDGRCEAVPGNGALALIAGFYAAYGRSRDGSKEKRYYPIDSVGIATGFLTTARQHAGLATLAHTPSPMAFLKTILHRPDNERPFVLLVVGYPAAGATVPAISRKSLSDIATFGERVTANPRFGTVRATPDRRPRAPRAAYGGLDADDVAIGQ